MVKLLVLDDEIDFGKAIQSLFYQEVTAGKYEIIYAQNGQEALEIVELDRGCEIDLILADLKMPADKIDGFTFMKTLHERQIYIKTIVISAYATVENYRQAIQEQVLFFLSKPLEDLKILKPLVEEALNCSSQFDKETRKVRFNTILKAANSLPSRQKEKLFYKLAEKLEIESIKRLQKKMPDLLEKQEERAKKRQEEKELLIEKQRSGELDSNIPLELLEGNYIEERYIKRKNGDVHGPYYYLRWREDGQLMSRYLGKKDPRETS
jgi:YesN/AraC family two-component response regulator